MSPTNQALKSALTDARREAQRDRHAVICVIFDNETAATSHHDHKDREIALPGVRAIVRPDEPILYCGLFPA